MSQQLQNTGAENTKYAISVSPMVLPIYLVSYAESVAAIFIAFGNIPFWRPNIRNWSRHNDLSHVLCMYKSFKLQCFEEANIKHSVFRGLIGKPETNPTVKVSFFIAASKQPKFITYSNI